MGAENLLEKLQELYDILYYGLGVAELGIAGAVLIGGLIVGLVVFIFELLVSFVVFMVGAIPLYKISKKLGRKHAWMVWLSWIPTLGGYISTYVLSDIPGEKPLKLFGNIAIQNRLMSFWIRVGISLFGTTLVTSLIAIVNFIPVVGQIVGTFSTLLYLAPVIASAWLDYAYLRDVLDIFRADKKSNNTVAVVIAMLDTLATLGFARAIYLYTVMNKHPLPQQEVIEQTI